MNVKPNKEKKARAATRPLSVIHPDAAGIDVGSRMHVVAVPADRDDEPVRTFGCTTPRLIQMARWLSACGVQTVAMESTGVYWVPVAQVLEAHDIEVVLVNAAHVKGVPGRKSDVSDSQWLQQLHSLGLLRAAFRPEREVSVLRGYWRHRETLVEEMSRQIQRMQKSLEQMNLQLHKVLSDLGGKSGMAILKAILSGERDPGVLADLADYRVKSSHEERVEALTGDWREEQVFILGQCMGLYETFRERIDACDRAIERYMETLEKKTAFPPQGSCRPRRKSKNGPKVDLHRLQWSLTGVDLTRIDGIDVLTAQTIVSEIGFDVRRFPSEACFSSWLGLCPNRKITGGRVKSSRSRKIASRVATALRRAAGTVQRSRSWLGAYHRKMKSRLGPLGAITATAHKLAQQVYRMLKYGGDYVDKGAELFEAKQSEREKRALFKLAKKQGFSLIDSTTGEVIA